MKCLTVLTLLVASIANLAAYEIYSNYPSANIEVVKKSDDGAIVRQQLRDSDWWFYWAFGVKDAGGKKLTFKFDSGDIIGSRGAAVSLDAGKTWQWLGTDSVVRGKNSVSFAFDFPKNANDVRFAFSFPYMPSDFDNFLKSLPSNVKFEKIDFCKTRRGRENSAYIFGNKNAKIKLLFTSRHHACEATGTYVMEGILREILTTESGKWLAENAEIITVPFVDLDGVMDGDQGKGRKPYDHNRDYLEKPSRYPTVAAIKKIYTEKSATAEAIAGLDLHSPFIFRGGQSDTNNRTYFVNVPQKKQAANIDKLSLILEAFTSKCGANSVVHSHNWNVKYGTLWNNNPKPQKISAWLSLNPKTEFAATIEIPYSENEGVTMTPQNMLQFGANVAKAIDAYFNPDSQTIYFNHSKK